MRAGDLTLFEPAGCKMLLMEVLRRAAHDWVLYRDSTSLLQRQLADEAYHWLFVEEPGTASWAERTSQKQEFMSFLSICETLDLDPELVRTYARRLTIRDILSTGRPPTYRRRKERKHTLVVVAEKLQVVALPTPILASQGAILVRPKLLVPVASLQHLFETASQTVDRILMHARV